MCKSQYCSICAPYTSVATRASVMLTAYASIDRVYYCKYYKIWELFISQNVKLHRKL